jgi:DnaJ-class molecular chaperone
MEKKTCHHCDGKGYIELRDCSGDIQRTENCSFCEGLGFIKQEEREEKSSDRDSNTTKFTT